MHAYCISQETYKLLPGPVHCSFEQAWTLTSSEASEGSQWAWLLECWTLWPPPSRLPARDLAVPCFGLDDYGVCVCVCVDMWCMCTVYITCTQHVTCGVQVYMYIIHEEYVHVHVYVYMHLTAHDMLSLSLSLSLSLPPLCVRHMQSFLPIYVQFSCFVYSKSEIWVSNQLPY